MATLHTSEGLRMQIDDISWYNNSNWNTLYPRNKQQHKTLMTFSPELTPPDTSSYAGLANIEGNCTIPASICLKTRGRGIRVINCGQQIIFKLTGGENFKGWRWGAGHQSLVIIVSCRSGHISRPGSGQYHTSKVQKFHRTLSLTLGVGKN